MALVEGGTRIDGAGVDSTGGQRGSVRPVTLNSRRLMAQRLRQLAGGFGVPSSASPEDLRAMIEGKLTEGGRDPLQTQVVLRTEERGVHMTLQDEDGVFLVIEPLPIEDPPPDDPEDADGGEGEAPEPAVVGELRVEVERLKTELEAQKSRVRELWKLNCKQLADMDSSLLQKDEEIEGRSGSTSRK